MLAEVVLMQTWQKDQSVAGGGPVQNLLRSIAGLDLMLCSAA